MPTTLTTHLQPRLCSWIVWCSSKVIMGNNAKVQIPPLAAEIIDDQERVFGTRAVVDLVAMKLEDLATACSQQLLITRI